MRYTLIMSNMSVKQFLVFFGIVTLSIAIIIAGTSVFLKWGAWQETPGDTSGAEKILGDIDNNEAGREEDLTSLVVYDGDEFMPERALVDGSGKLGCVALLINKSAEPLRVGISPHNQKVDPGPNYGVIAPGDKLLFDPRFTGITELRMHNHDKPQEEFVIELGSGCRL